jgi:iron complex outermembrane receptor protein
VTNEDGNFQWFTSPTQINQLAGRNPLSILNQQNNFGTSYRSIGNIQTEYKMHFLPELKAVANFGYDELIGRSFGNTDADYLNGLLVCIITPMKIQVQEIIN